MKIWWFLVAGIIFSMVSCGKGSSGQSTDGDFETNAACTPESRRCDGETVQKCDSTGDQWVDFKTCDAPEECRNGECISITPEGDGDQVESIEDSDKEIEILPPDGDGEEDRPTEDDSPDGPEMEIEEISDLDSIDQNDGDVGSENEDSGEVTEIVTESEEEGTEGVDELEHDITDLLDQGETGSEWEIENTLIWHGPQMIKAFSGLSGKVRWYASTPKGEEIQVQVEFSDGYYGWAETRELRNEVILEFQIPVGYPSKDIPLEVTITRQGESSPEVTVQVTLRITEDPFESAAGTCSDPVQMGEREVVYFRGRQYGNRLALPEACRPVNPNFADESDLVLRLPMDKAIEFSLFANYNDTVMAYQADPCPEPLLSCTIGTQQDEKSQSIERSGFITQPQNGESWIVVESIISSNIIRLETNPQVSLAGDICPSPMDVVITENFEVEGNLEGYYHDFYPTRADSRILCEANPLDIESFKGPEVVYPFQFPPEEQMIVTLDPLTAGWNPYFMETSACNTFPDSPFDCAINGNKQGPGMREVIVFYSRKLGYQDTGFFVIGAVDPLNGPARYQLNVSVNRCVVSFDNSNSPIVDNSTTGSDSMIGPNILVHQARMIARFEHPHREQLLIQAYICINMTEPVFILDHAGTGPITDLEWNLEFDPPIRAYDCLWSIAISDDTPGGETGQFYYWQTILNQDECNGFPCQNDYECPVDWSCSLTTNSCEQP